MKPLNKNSRTCLLPVFKKLWQPFTSFIFPLILYLQTLAPTVYNLDSAELTTAAATLGITRATGYPLYILVGFLFSKIPIFDVGYRINLFSAVCGALTILFVERILSVLKINNSVKLPAVFLLATANYFWYLSSIAEVYTLNTALMALFLWRLLIWAETPTQKNLMLAGITFGLNFSHHGSSVLLIPAVISFFFFKIYRQPNKGKTLFIFVSSAIAPLLLYLYLPIRYFQHPVFNYAGSFNGNGNFIPVDLSTLNGIFWLVSGKGFQNLMFAYTFPDFISELLSFWIHIGRSFWFIGLGPGLIGIYAAFKKERHFAISILLIFIMQMFFFSSYRVLDKQTMFLPGDLIWTIWFAFGIQFIFSWLDQPRISGSNIVSIRLIQILMIIMVVFSLIVNFKLVDQSDNYSTREIAFSIMGSLPPNATIIGYWDTIPAIQYYQLVEHLRPDVEAVNRFLIGPGQFSNFVDIKSHDNLLFFAYKPPDLPAGLKIEKEDEVFHVINN